MNQEDSEQNEVDGMKKGADSIPAKAASLPVIIKPISFAGRGTNIIKYRPNNITTEITVPCCEILRQPARSNV